MACLQTYLSSFTFQASSLNQMMNFKNTDTNLKNFGKRNLIVAIYFASLCSLGCLPVRAAQINFEQEFASENGQDIAELVLQLQQNSSDRYSKLKENQSQENKNQDRKNQNNLASKNLVTNLQNVSDSSVGPDSGISLGTILPVGAMVSLCLQAQASDDAENSDSESSSLLCYLPLLFTLADMLRDGDTDRDLLSNEFSSPKEIIDDIPNEKKAVPEPLSIIGTAIAGMMGCLMKRKYYKFEVKA